MGTQPQQSTEDAMGPKIIQIEVPGNTAIFYFEGGVRTAIQEMEQARRLMENSNDTASVEKMNEALSSMLALLDVTRVVKNALINEAQQRAMALAVAQGQDQENGVQASFVPKIESDDY
jgi:hypothetical protein